MPRLRVFARLRDAPVELREEELWIVAPDRITEILARVAEVAMRRGEERAHRVVERRVAARAQPRQLMQISLELLQRERAPLREPQRVDRGAARERLEGLGELVPRHESGPYREHVDDPHLAVAPS